MFSHRMSLFIAVPRVLVKTKEKTVLVISYHIFRDDKLSQRTLMCCFIKYVCPGGRGCA